MRVIPTDPREWLEVLAQRLDDRAGVLREQRQYLTGDAPLPEGATNHREAYRKFQSSARTNFAELAVDALVERMVISGFVVDGGIDDNDVARSIWRKSRMDAGAADVHRDMAGVGYGYAMAYRTRRGDVRLSQESPEVVAIDSDPRDPDDVRAGLKVWRDATAGLDVAVVHTPGRVTTFSRESSLIPWSGGWDTVVSDLPSGLSRVPIVEFVNRGGVGEFATHTDILNRINWTILQRLIITAMQAFRQRAIKGDLPEEDEEGNAIDYEQMFVPGADALWQLPDGVDLWESSQTDIGTILTAAKDDIQQFAAVTRTPMSVFQPEGQNQSAEGAALAREGLVFKAEDRMARAQASWDALIGLGLELAGSPADEVRVTWAPAERQSLSERADAATKAVDLPWRSRLSHVWGFSGEAIDAMEAERATDALNTALLQPAPAITPVGGVNGQQDNGGADTGVTPGSETPTEGAG